VGEAERVADLVRQHHEQVASATAVQGPALVSIKVRFAPAGQEGVCQGAPWAIEGVAQSIIVVPLEEGEADVSGAGGWGLPKFQR
jgi:hypothetical protein